MSKAICSDTVLVLHEKNHFCKMFVTFDILLFCKSRPLVTRHTIMCVLENIEKKVTKIKKFSTKYKCLSANPPHGIKIPYTKIEM